MYARTGAGNPDRIRGHLRALVRHGRGVVELPALFARIEGPHGPRIRYETRDGVVHAGNWIRERDTASWTFELPAAGRCRLVLDHAVEPGQGGSETKVLVNGAQDGPAFRVFSTKGDFRERRVAEFDLKKGPNTIKLHPVRLPRGRLMDLRGAFLRPCP